MSDDAIGMGLVALALKVLDREPYYEAKVSSGEYHVERWCQFTVHESDTLSTVGIGYSAEVVADRLDHLLKVVYYQTGLYVMANATLRPQEERMDRRLVYPIQISVNDGQDARQEIRDSDRWLYPGRRLGDFYRGQFLHVVYNQLSELPVVAHRMGLRCTPFDASVIDALIELHHWKENPIVRCLDMLLWPIIRLRRSTAGRKQSLAERVNQGRVP